MAYCLVGKDPSDLPATSAALPTWPTLPEMVAVFLRGPQLEDPPPAHPHHYLHSLPSGIKQQPISIYGGLFKVAHSSCCSHQELFPHFGDCFCSKNGGEM